MFCPPAVDVAASETVFGTEYPLQHPTVELAKYAALHLDPRHWQAVAWDNARRLLGEDPA